MFASDVLVIDGVVLWDFDYIDLGRIRLPSRTVPVTIKSLVFSDDPRSRQILNAAEHDHSRSQSPFPWASSPRHHHHHGHSHDSGHGGHGKKIV